MDSLSSKSWKGLLRSVSVRAVDVFSACARLTVKLIYMRRSIQSPRPTTRVQHTHACNTRGLEHRPIQYSYSNLSHAQNYINDVGVDFPTVSTLDLKMDFTSIGGFTLLKYETLQIVRSLLL